MDRKTRQPNVRLLKKIEIYLKKKENEKGGNIQDNKPKQ